MSTGTQRLSQAQSDLQAAQIVITQERKEQMRQELKAAIKQGRAIDEQIKTNGAELVKARAQAEPLWTKREAISKARTALDEAFQQNDFPSDEEIEQYETKRSELTGEWHQLTQKIIALSGVIARLQAEYERLKFSRSRQAMGIKDLRLALDGELVGTQRM